MQLIILGALDKSGLQSEAGQLLMMFGDLTTLRVDLSETNGSLNKCICLHRFDVFDFCIFSKKCDLLAED